jgi:hypothetical protein
MNESITIQAMANGYIVQAENFADDPLDLVPREPHVFETFDALVAHLTSALPVFRDGPDFPPLKSQGTVTATQIDPNYCELCQDRGCPNPVDAKGASKFNTGVVTGTPQNVNW